MQIKLIEPNVKGWLLIAVGLNDPQGWSRLNPHLDVDSERHAFESASKEFATTVKLAVCKDLVAPGTSAFEYAWDCNESDILDHALGVADRLNVDLLFDDKKPTGPTNAPTAA